MWRPGNYLMGEISLSTASPLTPGEGRAKIRIGRLLVRKHPSEGASLRKKTQGGSRCGGDLDVDFVLSIAQSPVTHHSDHPACVDGVTISGERQQPEPPRDDPTWPVASLGWNDL
jgi:hypothetical protein